MTIEGIEAIHNFLKLSDRIATAGQPKKRAIKSL